MLSNVLSNEQSNEYYPIAHPQERDQWCMLRSRLLHMGLSRLGPKNQVTSNSGDRLVIAITVCLTFNASRSFLSYGYVQQMQHVPNRGRIPTGLMPLHEDTPEPFREGCGRRKLTSAIGWHRAYFPSTAAAVIAQGCNLVQCCHAVHFTTVQ